MFLYFSLNVQFMDETLQSEKEVIRLRPKIECMNVH